MSSARSVGPEPCPFCHTPVPGGATYCTACQARYGYKDPDVQRSFRAWLMFLVAGLVILTIGVAGVGAGGLFGGGEGPRTVIIAAGGLMAAFGGLGTVLAGLSLGLALMRGKAWWR
jgi:hypothetical protein